MKGCPTVDCEGYLRAPQEDPRCELPAECGECSKLYCYKCLHLFHPGESCEEKIDKDYQEWAEPNSATVGTCKKCWIRIEKDGGCPHMICPMCKHEWCWICKQDFPVHTPECPNFHLY